MWIEMNQDERAVAYAALSTGEKALEAILPRLDELTLPTVHANAALGAVQACRRAITAATDGQRDDAGELPPGLVIDFTMKEDEQGALLTALAFYHGKLTKVAEAQGKLAVEPVDTTGRAEAVRELSARVRGQESLFPRSRQRHGDDTTVSFNGGPKIPLDTFIDRVDAMATREP